VHVRIDGVVQGVGYRTWAESHATQLELTGWVRNRHDGSVEAVFQGSPDQVDEMLRLCERGPLDARVSSIELLGEGGGAYDDFEVLPTR
jgi:acylphosphatase